MAKGFTFHDRGLLRNLSTTQVIGLSRILSPSERLEKVRKEKGTFSQKLFAISTSIGLAFKIYRVHNFAVKYPDCPPHILERLVTHGADELGGFDLSGVQDKVRGLIHETRLLITCGFHVAIGNSVRYEFGFRWYNQTLFNVEFKKNYLEMLDVQPVLGFGSFSSLVSPESDLVSKRPTNEECVDALIAGTSDANEVHPDLFKEVATGIAVPLRVTSESLKGYSHHRILTPKTLWGIERSFSAVDQRVRMVSSATHGSSVHLRPMEIEPVAGSKGFERELKQRPPDMYSRDGLSMIEVARSHGFCPDMKRVHRTEEEYVNIIIRANGGEPPPKEVLFFFPTLPSCGLPYQLSEFWRKKVPQVRFLSRVKYKRY